MLNEFITQNILWVGAFVLVANLLFLSFIRGGVKGVSTISALALPQLQRNGKSLILDVRDTASFSKSHIPAAINMPIANINAENANLLKHKEKTVILVCQTGSTSNKAAKQLLTLGFTDLHVLTGGIIAWNKENLPVSSD